MKAVKKVLNQGQLSDQDRLPGDKAVQYSILHHNSYFPYLYCILESLDLVSQAYRRSCVITLKPQPLLLIGYTPFTGVGVD